MTPDHSALIERLEANEFRGPMQHLRDWSELDRLHAEAAAALRDLTERLADANQSVCAFCAPWAVTYARDHGLPEGSLFADHYDTLEKAGARMVSFTRWLPSAPNQAKEAGE